MMRQQLTAFAAMIAGLLTIVGWLQLYARDDDGPLVQAIERLGGQLKRDPQREGGLETV